MGSCLTKFHCSSNDWLYVILISICLSLVYHHNYPFPGSPYPHPYPEAGPESFPGPYPEHVPHPVLHHQKYQESDKNKGKQKLGDEKKGKESKQHWLDLPIVKMSHFQFIEAFRFEDENDDEDR